MDYASFVFRHLGEKPVCVVSTEHLVESVFGDILQAAKSALAPRGDAPRAIAQLADGRQVAVGSAFCALLTGDASKVAHAVLSESQDVAEASANYKVHKSVGDFEILVSGRGRELYVRAKGESEPKYMIEFDTFGGELSYNVFEWKGGEWQESRKIPPSSILRAAERAYTELFAPTESNESVSEASDDKTEIAQTILQQLGGRMFMVMTGAKVFGVDGDDSRVSLKLKIGRGARNGIALVVITYNRGADDYSMSFQTRAGRVVKEYDGIYADNLASLFKEETGFDTSLGTMGRRMESIDEAAYGAGVEVTPYPYRGSREKMWLVRKDGTLLGYVTKVSDTKTETHPWKAFRYKNPTKAETPDDADADFLGTTYRGKLKVAVAAVVSGQKLPQDTPESIGEAVALKDVTKTTRLSPAMLSAKKVGSARITPDVYDWAVKKFAKSNLGSVTNEATAIEKQLITIVNLYGPALGTETVQVHPVGDYIRVSSRLKSPVADRSAEIKYFAMPTNENRSDRDVYDYLFEMKMSKSDREVIDAFIDQKPADSQKFTSDGKRLDGNWMGGRGIAKWENDLIVFADLGSKAAQAIHRLIRKMAPKMSLHPDDRRSDESQGMLQAWSVWPKGEVATSSNPNFQVVYGKSKKEVIARARERNPKVDPKTWWIEPSFRSDADESLDEAAEQFKRGTKVRVPHKGKMVSGKIVRFDGGGTSKAGQHGGGYIVDVGGYASIIVPPHDIKLDEGRAPAKKMYAMIRTIEDETVDKLDKLVRSASPGPEAAYRVMTEANKLIDGHGVEQIVGTLKGEKGVLLLLYVNMGDTYDATLCYDAVKKSFFVGDWGGWVEQYGDKYQVESLSIDEAVPSWAGASKVYSRAYRFLELLGRDGGTTPAKKARGKVTVSGSASPEMRELVTALNGGDEEIIKGQIQHLADLYPKLWREVLATPVNESLSIDEAQVNEQYGASITKGTRVRSLEDDGVGVVISTPVLKYNAFAGEDIYHFRVKWDGIGKTQQVSINDIEIAEGQAKQPDQWTGKKSYRTVHVVWSPVNSAWITMFGDKPTGIGDSNKSIWRSLDDLKYELKTLKLKLGKKVGNGYEIANAD